MQFKSIFRSAASAMSQRKCILCNHNYSKTDEGYVKLESSVGNIVELNNLAWNEFEKIGPKLESITEVGIF